jgi:hypothetical protein
MHLQAIFPPSVYRHLHRFRRPIRRPEGGGTMNLCVCFHSIVSSSSSSPAKGHQRCFLTSKRIIFGLHIYGICPCSFILRSHVRIPVGATNIIFGLFFGSRTSETKESTKRTAWTSIAHACTSGSEQLAGFQVLYVAAGSSRLTTSLFFFASEIATTRSVSYL